MANRTAALARQSPTTLLPSTFRQRYERNRDYVNSLTSVNLLRPYLFEAGLWSYSGSSGPATGPVDSGPAGWHGGWESLSSEVRGHTLGHWLSAAAHLSRDDQVLAARAAHIVSELARCQQANGGGWIGPFPEKYLSRIAAGRTVWAPQYTLHKILMGLFDMYAVAGNQQALEVLVEAAGWFTRWTDQFSRDELDDLLDVETGGMLEVWADLYGVTHDEQHAELIRRYDRRRFFDQLLAGADVLTNRHANTQIPEVLGAARAWEVTGETRWRDIVEAFWRSAVTERGTFCTGGASSGEFWQPPFEQSARLNDTQEHCTVYNMMRLADALHRWTGDTSYADHWERLLLNGVLAQQHPETGMVSYFLPLAAGSHKTWGSPTGDFWCCHGTLMQAHSSYASAVATADDRAITVSQYLPSRTRWEELSGTGLTLTLTQDTLHGVPIGRASSAEQVTAVQHLAVPPMPTGRPEAFVYEIEVACDAETELELRLRVPSWVAGEPTVTVNGEETAGVHTGGHLILRRSWRQDRVRLVLPKQLSVEPLPDAPDTVAFLDGPLVLAGLVGEDRQLVGDPDRPSTLLTPDQERQHSWWNTGHYRTRGQQHGFRLIPLSDVRDETYSVYFPILRTGTDTPG